MEITFISKLVGFFTGLPAIVQGMVASFAINKVSEELGLFDQDIRAVNYESSIKTNNTSNTYGIPVVYGKRIVGGSEYRFISGTNNEFLHRIICFCEGEIEDIERLYFNDKDISTNANYNTLTNIEKKRGLATQTATTLALSDVNLWNNTMTGNGIAYAHVKIQFDADVFSSVPRLTALIKGKKVYDPRDNTQSAAVPTTFTWSDNPALCILDYLTNTTYGRSIPFDDIDLTSFINEANYCDELIDYLDSSGNTVNQKRYTCNGVINPDETALNNIKKLCSSCRAVIIPPGDKYKIAIDKAGTPSFTFNEDNIIGDLVLSGGDLREKKNQARVRFFDKDNNYDEAIHVTTSQDFITEDNNQLLTAELKYSFTDSYTRANYLAHQHIKQSRETWKVGFKATIEALKTQVMDLVYIKSSIMGWNTGALSNGKTFRITQLEYMPDETVNVQAEEYDPSVYTVDLDTPPSIPNTNLPDPFDTRPPTNLIMSSAEEDGGLVIANDGTLISQIKLNWTAPALAFVRHYEVGFSLANQDAFTTIITTSTEFFCSPVADTQTYDIRVRAVYTSGQKSDYLTGQHQVQSKSRKPMKPASLSFATGKEYTQVYSWELNTVEKDVAGYKIRYESYQAGDTIATLLNNNAWDNMSRLHEGLLLTSPHESYLLSRGFYNFAIKTVDTSGNESETATYLANVEVENSPFRDILDAFYPRLDGWLTVGTLSSGFVDTATGSLEANGSKSWEDLGSTTWASATSWDHEGALSTVDYTTNGNFFTDINGNSIELTYRPSVQVQGRGVAAIQFAYSSNGSTFGAFTTNVETVTNRGIKVRVIMTGENAAINNLSILLDGKGLEEEIIEVDTSTLQGSVGARKLVLSNTFSQIRTVSINFVGSYAGYNYNITSKTSTDSGGNVAPTIQIVDASGNNADAVIDAIVKGF